jgi:ArsR family transcriptional regulator
MLTQSAFEIQAKLCQAMGHAIRLEIVYILRDEPKRVGDLVEILDLPQPTVSRHVSILRNAGILTQLRGQGGLFYQIANPKILNVCDLMREVLTEQYAQQSQLIDQL